MDPRSKPNAAIHQFLVSGRGAVAVEFAFVLPIILLIIWAFWQMSESYRLQWTLNRQTASLADMLINQPEQLNLGVVRSLSRSRSSSSFRYSLRAPMRC